MFVGCEDVEGMRLRDAFSTSEPRGKLPTGAQTSLQQITFGPSILFVQSMFQSLYLAICLALIIFFFMLVAVNYSFC